MLHGALMATKYEVISQRGIWHILRLYHRTVMQSADSEAIAEHVGSIMRYVEARHSCGRPLEPPQLVRAVRLRALGVKGDLSDVGLIRRALREMFGVARPLDWNVFVGPRALAARGAMLGPSSAVHRIRMRALDEVATRWRFPWLLRDDHVPHVTKAFNMAACAQVACWSVPDDLPREAWDAVESHVRLVHALKRAMGHLEFFCSCMLTP